jgi:hypothetical protein
MVIKFVKGILYLYKLYKILWKIHTSKKFGPFCAIFRQICRIFGRGFSRPLILLRGHFCVLRPKFRPVGNTVLQTKKKTMWCISGSRPGSTDGDGFPVASVHNVHHNPHQPDQLQYGRHHLGLHPPPPVRGKPLAPGLLPPGQEMGLPVAPRIRALQNKLKMTEACDAQGSLVWSWKFLYDRDQDGDFWVT